MQDSETIRAQIAETEARYPIPAWDHTRRKERLWVLRLLPPGGVGLEVGVFRGCFSESICEIAKPRKLYLVDPWTLSGETFGWGKEYTCFGTLETAVARRETELRAALYPEVEAVLIEGLFPDCADRITEPLDWAYIDSSHRYDETRRELESLQHMVRPEGLILGDDWAPDPDNIHHGVYRAVNDFVAQGGWEIVKAGPGMQWAIRRCG